MTSSHDQDAFEIRFEGALDDMHTRTHRGNAPSAKTWQTVQAGLSGQSQRAATADPRAMGPDSAPVSRRTHRMRKESEMDLALTPTLRSPQPRIGRGMFTMVAIALVGVLMASSVYWFGQTPPGNDGGQLAWAPGMASPESSPVAGYACDVEPLTTDEVMEIVRNPQTTYQERGFELDQADEIPTYQEARIDWSQRAVSPSMLATGDPALVGPINELGNTFWSCLVTGTSAQVWSMMDPSLLQWTILQNFDVVRTEDDISQFVDEWSSQPHTILPGGIYPQFRNVDVRDIGYIVDPELGGIKISTARGPLEEEVRVGVMRMIPAPESQGAGFYEIYITENPDGSWFVTWVEPSPETDSGEETPGG